MLSTLNVIGLSGADGSHLPVAFIVPMSFTVSAVARSYPAVGSPAAVSLRSTTSRSMSASVHEPMPIMSTASPARIRSKSAFRTGNTTSPSFRAKMSGLLMSKSGIETLKSCFQFGSSIVKSRFAVGSFPSERFPISPSSNDPSEIFSRIGR